MDKKIKNLLNSDPDGNIAAIGFFDNYPLDSFVTEGESAILFGKSDYLWAHIISKDENELGTLLGKTYRLTNRYFSVEDWMIPIIEEYGDREWLMKTNRYVLNPKTKIKHPNIKTKRLEMSYSKYIYNHSDYKKYLSIEYIEDRLKKDISAGIFEDGNLIAWGFTHDDGALGFLHVLEEHRKKGLGLDIILFLIDERRTAGKPIFCNIVPENTPSIRLVEKLGFHLDRSQSWIKLVE